DRVTGEFTEEDEVLLVELAHITANAVQRLHLDEARRAAVDESEKQRAEAEEARREAELARQEIESIFSSITDAVYVLDVDWRFTFLNRRAEEILERKAADLIGRYV